jgi:beta-lactamase class A
MVEVGAPSLRVLRGVEDGPAHAAGLDSTVTAAGLASLLGGLALGQVGSPAASAEMISVLAGQTFNDGIPAGLPAGACVAHKTGSITRLYHDAALVLDGPGAPWVLVVLTQGLEEGIEAPALVAAIARDVHRELAGRAMGR